MTPMIAYKVVTHRLCAPIQGGNPIWDGELPYTLPRVEVDQSEEDCAAGWHCCRNVVTALRIAGLWPDGRPSRVFQAQTEAAVLERGDKLRAATWTLVRELPESEIVEAIRQLSTPFGDLRDEITAEQAAWRTALGRPMRNEQRVEEELRRALEWRGLRWGMRRLDDAYAVWSTWSSSWQARDARADWETREAWKSWMDRGIWEAWEATDAWIARDTWEAREIWASTEAMGAKAVENATNSLTVWYSARRGWTRHDPMLLTTGLREAYQHGLAIAIPTGSTELGWAMEEP